MLTSQSIIHKTRDDYNRIARHFSDTRNRVWPELEQFSHLIKAKQNILDWGCGNANILNLFNKKEIKYFGVDQSVKLLEQAKKKFPKLIKTGQAKFFNTAKRQKKFPNDFFDLVFMIASFHHLPDKKSRLQILHKTLKEMKPEAKLIITVWNLESDWAKKKIKKDWKKIGENDYLIPWKNQDGKVEVERYYHHFSKNELRDLLEESDFKIKKLEYFSKNTFSADKVNSRNLVALAEK